MDLSKRLTTVAAMADPCCCIADIGTDHAYIPIYLIKNHICSRAIASDINKGPVQKAKLNVSSHSLSQSIDCRLGSGLNTLRSGEAEAVIIAGMGGNLIRDILDERLDLVKGFKYLILQPVQNPEVLREYLYTKGYEILEEDLCIDENIFYEIIKIRYAEKKYNIDSIYYEVAKSLVENRHPLISDFILKKINDYYKILGKINDNSQAANARREELSSKIKKLEEMLK